MSPRSKLKNRHRAGTEGTGITRLRITGAVGCFCPGGWILGAGWPGRACPGAGGTCPTGCPTGGGADATSKLKVATSAPFFTLAFILVASPLGSFITSSRTRPLAEGDSFFPTKNRSAVARFTTITKSSPFRRTNPAKARSWAKPAVSSAATAVKGDFLASAPYRSMFKAAGNMLLGASPETLSAEGEGAVIISSDAKDRTQKTRRTTPPAVKNLFTDWSF